MLIPTYYSVIGDEITYRIGLLLSRYALSVKQLGVALKLEQPRVSHKLAKLRKHGCVGFERQGQRVIYRFQEPCRTILLKGDFLWRQMNPEFSNKWAEDLKRLQAALDEDLQQRTVHPVIGDGEFRESIAGDSNTDSPY